MHAYEDGNLIKKKYVSAFVGFCFDSNYVVDRIPIEDYHQWISNQLPNENLFDIKMGRCHLKLYKSFTYRIVSKSSSKLQAEAIQHVKSTLNFSLNRMYRDISQCEAFCRHYLPVCCFPFWLWYCLFLFYLLFYIISFSICILITVKKLIWRRTIRIMFLKKLAFRSIS